MDFTDEQIGGFAFLIWYVIVSCGMAVLFRRTGRNVWTAFIPVWNAVEVCRLAGLSGWWVLTVFIPLVNLFAPLYVCLKLSERLNVNLGIGVAVWLSAFTLLPIFVLVGKTHAGESPVNDDRSFSNSQEVPRTAVGESVAAGDWLLHDAGPAIASPDDRAHRASLIGMIVLTCAYLLGLVCVPGLLVIGTMAFGGATQEQIDQADIVLGLLALTPVSILIALIGGWVLHACRRHAAALALVVLPILNALAVFGSFVWVVS